MERESENRKISLCIDRQHTHMYKFQHIGETKCYIETGNNTNKNENEDHKRAQKLNALAYVCFVIDCFVFLFQLADRNFVYEFLAAYLYNAVSCDSLTTKSALRCFGVENVDQIFFGARNAKFQFQFISSTSHNRHWNTHCAAKIADFNMSISISLSFLLSQLLLLIHCCFHLTHWYSL